MHCFVLLPILAVIIQGVVSESLHRAERGARNRDRKAKNAGCSPWVFEVCVPSNGQCGPGKKLARRSGANCKKIQKVINCQAPCDGSIGGIKDTVPTDGLVDIDSPHNNDRKHKKKNKDCKYRSSQWSSCDPIRNTITMTKALKKGGPDCPPTKVVTKNCKKLCRYKKGPWSTCSPGKDTRTRTLTLKAGDKVKCEETKKIVKRCKKQRGAAKRGKGCKYHFEKWSDCNKKTNTITRRLVLRSGNPESCVPIKNITRKCKKECKFAKGTWSKCDPVLKMKTRTDKLKPGSKDFCEKTRVIERKCPKKEKKCVYEFGEWSECNADTNLRSRERMLKAGDPVDCDDVKVKTKPCTRPNGNERCFFGGWGIWGACQNGVKTKRREVKFGGDDCQRKAVKTKACRG